MSSGSSAARQPARGGRAVAGAVVALRRAGTPLAWAATLLFALLMVAWTIVTPGFRNPDEPQHVNSVLRVAEGEGWPPPSEAYMAPEVLRAKTLTGFSAIDGQVGNWAGGTLLPGVRAGVAPQDLMYYALFSSQSPTPVDDRLPFDALTLDPGVDLTQHGDQMTQHPPLYYAVDAGVLHAFGALDWRFDRTLALMRLCSVAMVLPLPLLAAATARRFTRRRRVADLAAFLPLAVPQLAALGGSVTNDALVILLGGVLTYCLARILTGDRSWRTVVLVGVTLGLALLTKGTMLAAVPVAGLAVVVGARRAVALPWGAVLGRLAVVWGAGFVIGGWWWAVNYLRYGTFQPDGVPQDGLDGLVVDRPRVSVWAFGDVFWDKITITFWGDFGQLELPLAQPLVVALTVVLVLLVLLAFRARGGRLPLLILLSFPVVVLLALFAGTYLGASGLRPFRRDPGALPLRRVGRRLRRRGAGPRGDRPARRAGRSCAAPGRGRAGARQRGLRDVVRLPWLLPGCGLDPRRGLGAHGPVVALAGVGGGRAGRDDPPRRADRSGLAVRGHRPRRPATTPRDRGRADVRTAPAAAHGPAPASRTSSARPPRCRPDGAVGTSFDPCVTASRGYLRV